MNVKRKADKVFNSIQSLNAQLLRDTEAAAQSDLRKKAKVSEILGDQLQTLMKTTCSSNRIPRILAHIYT